MKRTADSPQEVWLQRFLTCPTDERTAKQRQGLDHPASWWFNPTNVDSLRLSLQGYNLVRKFDLPNWQFELSSNVVAKTYLQMERHFTSPYYVTNKKVTVWGERESIMLALHGNNLQQYLDNLSENG